MAFDWLKQFQQEQAKPANYAEKTLAQYRLGMKARGSIAGVRIVVDSHSCQAAHALEADAIYHPDAAPHLPLPACDKPTRCQCVYRPVMAYEADKGDGTQLNAAEDADERS